MEFDLRALTEAEEKYKMCIRDRYLSAEIRYFPPL